MSEVRCRRRSEARRDEGSGAANDAQFPSAAFRTSLIVIGMSFPGKLWFVTSPGTVDRCLRILLSGLADLPFSRGRLNRHRQ